MTQLLGIPLKKQQSAFFETSIETEYLTPEGFVTFQLKTTIWGSVDLDSVTNNG